MALDSGKKEVKLKTIDSHVPHVPAKSNLSIAYDSFKPTINRLQNHSAHTIEQYGEHVIANGNGCDDHESRHV